MFCRKCGKEIPDDSLFCPRCGTPLNGKETDENHETDKSALASTDENNSSRQDNSKKDDTDRVGSHSPAREAPQSDETVTASPSLVMVKEKPKSSKKAMIIVLAVLGVLLVAGLIIFIAYVNRDQYPDFRYHLTDDDTYVIDGYKGNEPNVVIPDEMYGKPVVRINDGAFAELNIESVTIGSNMKEIGYEAFKGTNLKSVTLQKLTPVTENVPSDEVLDALTLVIDSGAFSGCNNLSEFNIPYDSIVSVGDLAFEGCSQLKSITLASVSEMGYQAFASSGLETALIGGKLGTAAFENCKSLKEFTIRTVTTELTPRVFANCTALEKVDWNCNIYSENSIPQDAFEGCTSLRQIIIAGETATYPKQITEIIKKYKDYGAKYFSFSNDAFKDCKYFKDPVEPEKPKMQYHEYAASNYIGKTLRQIVNSVDHWDVGWGIPGGPCSRLDFYGKAYFQTLYYNIPDDYNEVVDWIWSNDENFYVSSNLGRTDFIHPGMTAKEVFEYLGKVKINSETYELFGEWVEDIWLQYSVNGFHITMDLSEKSENGVIESITVSIG